MPLKPEDAEGLYEVYLSKGVHATTIIEDNDLTEKEVCKRREGHRTLPKSREFLGQKVAKIVEACNQVVSRPSQALSPRWWAVPTLRK